MLDVTKRVTLRGRDKGRVTISERMRGWLLAGSAKPLGRKES